MTKRIAEFDIWRPGYGGAVVSIFLPGTTTLADVFLDEALTIEADNPQTLSAQAAADGTRYGKFAAPVYCGTSYFLSIDGIEDTGIMRPGISDLDGQDASDALVTPTGSTHEIALGDLLSLISVNVASFGEFVEGAGGNAATNTDTLELAIAALPQGGEVVIPAGTYKVSAIDVPQDVVLRGQGADATTLQSIIGDVSFTLVGARAGFRNITLDGSTLMTGSIGVKSVGNDETVFDNVTIRRFKVGAHFLGGVSHVWQNFSIENTETGAKLHGDLDAGDTGLGGIFGDLMWLGGKISVATTIGLSLSYEDAVCHNINLIGLGFESCTATALDINGAQSIYMPGVYFEDNVRNIDLRDDTATLPGATAQLNDVIDVRIVGGRMSAGDVRVTGTCQDVILQNVKLETVSFTLSTPLSNFLILQDCNEDSGVTISGETTKLLRNVTSNNGASFGLTTSNVATKAWSMAMEPGQMVYLVGKVIGKGRNVVQRAAYHIAVCAYRPGSTLAYDTQTANFTAGAVLTGASSGATARIQADSDSGTTGTLTLTDIRGVFLDNEIITDNNGSPGSATVNGTLSAQNVSLDTVGVTSLRTAYETNANWAAVFVANGGEIELRVTGDTSQTVEWTVFVDVVST